MLVPIRAARRPRYPWLLCGGGACFVTAPASPPGQRRAAGTTYDHVPKARKDEHRAARSGAATGAMGLWRVRCCSTVSSPLHSHHHHHHHSSRYPRISSSRRCHPRPLPPRIAWPFLPPCVSTTSPRLTFSTLREGELPKTRQRFKTLVLDSHRAKEGKNNAIQAGYARSLDAVDRWGQPLWPTSPGQPLLPRVDNGDRRF
jgi:hypothetical protein